MKITFNTPDEINIELPEDEIRKALLFRAHSILRDHLDQSAGVELAEAIRRIWQESLSDVVKEAIMRSPDVRRIANRIIRELREEATRETDV